MAKGNINLDFRIKKIDGTRNYFLEEIKHNDLRNEMHKKLCRALTYCIFPFSGYVSISAFASLVDVSASIASSAEGLKICALITEIKMYNSVISTKKKT